MSYTVNQGDGRQYIVQHFILKKVALSGKHIMSASAQRHYVTEEPEIHFTLDGYGARTFSEITEKHRVGNGDPRLLAIIVDGKLISAPTINGRIHARGQITGDFTVEEATALANALENQLENQVLLVEEKDLK
jgi:preprotein translocase subunit SecD